jgi:hypothetical protein
MSERFASWWKRPATSTDRFSGGDLRGLFLILPDGLGRFGLVSVSLADRGFVQCSALRRESSSDAAIRRLRS